ncbi:MAG: hypothetical protein Q8M07_25835, partial [Prosthecobacter sp.]|nr:hypothetical protein [Prosthecobacter sp.]
FITATPPANRTAEAMDHEMIRLFMRRNYSFYNPLRNKNPFHDKVLTIEPGLPASPPKTPTF